MQGWFPAREVDASVTVGVSEIKDLAHLGESNIPSFPTTLHVAETAVEVAVGDDLDSQGIVRCISARHLFLLVNERKAIQLA